METRWQLRRGFTIVELLVVIAVITVLAALLLPVYARARERSKDLSCLSNAREIGLAALLYSQDAEDSLPPSAWYDQIRLYVKNYQIFVCPTGKYASFSYSMNPNVQNLRLTMMPHPAKIVLFGDGYQDPAQGGAATMIYSLNDPFSGRQDKGQIAFRHSEGANFTFCDGHSAWVARGSISFEMWRPQTAAP